MWNWIERLGWIVGIIGVLWGIWWTVHPAPAEPAAVEGAASAAPPYVPPSGIPSPPPYTPPEHPAELPTRLADAAFLKSVFSGALVERNGTSKQIGYGTGTDATLIRTQDKLYAEGNELVFRRFEREQTASQPWVEINEPAARNPRMETRDEECRAQRVDLGSPSVSTYSADLPCGGEKCWRCVTKITLSFPADQVPNVDQKVDSVAALLPPKTDDSVAKKAGSALTRLISRDRY